MAKYLKALLELQDHSDVIYNKAFEDYALHLTECGNKDYNDKRTCKHHIIPKSRSDGYFGGEDSKYNLITLSYFDHLIAHFYLRKFTKGKGYTQMNSAFFLMCTARNGLSREMRTF